MTIEEMEYWAKRESIAIERIGGALALLALPKEIGDLLKKTTDVKVKALMLEEIADRTEEIPFI